MGPSSGSGATVSVTGSGHIPLHSSLPPPPPACPAPPSMAATVANFTVARSTRLSPPRLASGSDTSPNISNLSGAGRKRILLATNTVTTTATTAIAAAPGDSTELAHFALSNLGLSVSNTAASQDIGLTEQAAASCVALQPPASLDRSFRPSGRVTNAPSLLSLVDIGIVVDISAPQKSSAAVHIVTAE
ncbi:hypothetical protein LDHU3_12.0690:CDS1 [Leishmania donovani]|uniref:Hypothetical_protein n=1 Tax=Leishmania donovani TaxID=5661 RepID=A0A6J8F7Z5_LEIDO|nr:hypothetical protein LDHU3_12.0690:CDS1 [Leishmania donovani]VDZ42909.1 hypothetical_protein [Leishmania donovani]